MTDLREQAALRDQCTVFLTGHGPVRPADLLASIPADTVPDRYGDGGVVAELEAEIAGLLGQPAGDQDRLLTVDDLTAIAEPPGTLLIELPQRDLGGQQPEWNDLRAQTDWARERGAAVHLDGARLFESATGYGRPLAEIAALFDTVYVSFYKGIGALAGCCLAGPADVLAEVREWRKRMGGTLHGLWPGAA